MVERVILGERSKSKRSGPELMEIARSSVVRVFAELNGRMFSHGTAFAYKQVIRDTGSIVYFVTNVHNFAGYLRAYNFVRQGMAAGIPDEYLRVRAMIEIDGGKREIEKIIAFKGALLSKHRPWEHDFAMFAVELEQTEPLAMFALPNEKDARAGETVYAFGFPKDTDLGITEGIVSHVYHENATNELYKWQIQHSIEINPGNSGGPTVDPYGVAIGLSTWGRGGVDAIKFSVNLNHSFNICRDSDQIEEISVAKIFARFVERAREEVRYGS